MSETGSQAVTVFERDHEILTTERRGAGHLHVSVSTAAPTGVGKARQEIASEGGHTTNLLCEPPIYRALAILKAIPVGDVRREFGRRCFAQWGDDWKRVVRDDIGRP